LSFSVSSSLLLFMDRKDDAKCARNPQLFESLGIYEIIS